MMRRVLRRVLFRPFCLRAGVPKEAIKDLTDEAQPEPTPEFPKIKPLDLEESLNYMNDFIPKSANLVEQCRLDSDEPYKYQEI